MRRRTGAGPDHAAPFVTPRYLDGEQHFWPRARWLALQRRMLRRHMGHALTTPLYKSAARHYAHWVKAVACGPAGLYFNNLPFTAKQQLPSVNQLTRPNATVREWVTTSGTAGAPLAVPLTGNDLERLASNEAAALALAGVRPDDLVLSTVAMDRQFVAGLAYWLGLQRLGAGCVRAGPAACSSWDALHSLVETYRPQWMIAAPSLLAQMCAKSGRRGGGPGPLRGIICIGEATRSAVLETNNLAGRLYAAFGCPVLNTYASTETCATFAESRQCRGGHLNPQLAICEIIDADGAVMPPGVAGEVVVTPLGVEGMPLIRFRTGDIAALYVDPCPCGRTTPRLGPVLGRQGQLLKISGVSVYPSAIFNALDGQKTVVDAAAVATRDAVGCDELTVYVELRSDTHGAREALRARLRSLLRVLPAIVYCDATTLRGVKTGVGRKPQRFVDRR